MPSTVTTDSGIAVSTLRADTVAVGIRNLVASVYQGTDTVSTSIPVKLIPGPPANMAITPEDSVLPAEHGSNTIIQVQVFDRYHNNVGAGQIVTFETSLGIITETGVTDSTGSTTALLTATTEIGWAIVTVRAGEAVGHVQIRYMRLTAAEVAIIVSPHRLPGDGISSATITATVLDSFGNPITDRTPVKFYQDTALATGRIIPNLSLIHI